MERIDRTKRGSIWERLEQWEARASGDKKTGRGSKTLTEAGGCNKFPTSKRARRARSKKKRAASSRERAICVRSLELKQRPGSPVDLGQKVEKRKTLRFGRRPKSGGGMRSEGEEREKGRPKNSQ